MLFMTMGKSDDDDDVVGDVSDDCVGNGDADE